jgi:hypothetical protein
MIQKTILFFALLLSMSSYGQKQQASPYSFFGIGNNFLSKTAEENIMGGTGTALSVPGNLNFSNPAALSGMMFTTYSVGAINTVNQLTDNETSQKNSVFSISYLGLGVPLGNKGGLIAGFRARSGVGYTMYATDAENQSNTYTFEGSGGASSLFLGGGYQIFKGFSLGVEASFLFGSVEHVVKGKTEGVIYDTQEMSDSSLRGLETKLGAFYSTMLTKTKSFSIGVSLENESTIKITETSTFSNGFFTTDQSLVRESLAPLTVKGETVIPLNTTFAIAYGRRSKWQTSLEYSSRKAQTFSGATLVNNTRGIVYTNYSRISFGGYYIPKFNSLKSYFQRVVYRYGLRYENTGMEFSGVPLTDVGMSFGVGLPLGKGLSSLNIGLEYGVKGEVSAALVEEKYFNVRMSMVLGDKWFRKRRID